MANHWIQRSRRKTPQASTSKYRSRFEAQIALTLNRVGATFDYESMKVSYTKEATYTPDFILPNGVIVEAKGYWLPSDRTKHLRVRECNPTLDIRFCFQNAHNTLNKKSKTTYADWCDKHGFLWSQGSIPLEWIQKPHSQQQ